MKALSWNFNIKIFQWGNEGIKAKVEKEKTMRSLAPRIPSTALQQSPPSTWRRPGLITSFSLPLRTSHHCHPQALSQHKLRPQVGSMCWDLSHVWFLRNGERRSQEFQENHSVWGPGGNAEIRVRCIEDKCQTPEAWPSWGLGHWRVSSPWVSRRGPCRSLQSSPSRSSGKEALSLPSSWEILKWLPC